MARLKGTKNKKTLERMAKVTEKLNPREELESMYLALKPKPSNTAMRFQILKLLMESRG